VAGGAETLTLYGGVIYGIVLAITHTHHIDSRSQYSTGTTTMSDVLTFFEGKFQELIDRVPEPSGYYKPRPYRTGMVRFRDCRMDQFELRRQLLEEAGLNVFMFPAHKIPGCDLLSDSGTTTMTTEQWANLLLGDEAYGSNEGYFEIRERIVQTFGADWEQRDKLRENFFLFHQGRSAEHAFFGILNHQIGATARADEHETLPGDVNKDLRRRIEAGARKASGAYYIVPNNSHFDTTEGNVEDNHMVALNLPCREHLEDHKDYPFRGNINIDDLAALLETVPDRIPLVYITITNNTGGGQPVSMENIKRARALTARHGVPLFFDACRFAENAWFIKHKESGYADRSIQSIVHEMFEQVDGFHISFKKDGLVNIGGAVCLKQGAAFCEAFPRFGELLTDHQILTEGHPTYGGLAGRDLKALSEGLKTVVRDEYLDARVHQVWRFGSKLLSYRIPIKEPVGGHAVYIDMDRFFEGVEARDEDFKGIAFTALLLFGGHRLCELGIYAFGAYKDGHEIPPDPRVNNVRASVPRLAYEDQDLFALCETIRVLHEHKDRIPSVEVAHGRNLNLRHFKSRFRFKL
jgi:tryptophanase